MKEKILKKLMEATPNTTGTNSVHWDGITYRVNLTHDEIHFLIAVIVNA